MAVIDIIDDINSSEYNKEKVDKFVNKYKLHPRKGLPERLTHLMFSLYQTSTGDNQHAGKWGCSSCIETVYNKLCDMLRYDNNLGKPLLNWEPKKKKKK